MSSRAVSLRALSRRDAGRCIEPTFLSASRFASMTLVRSTRDSWHRAAINFLALTCDIHNVCRRDYCTLNEINNIKSCNRIIELILHYSIKSFERLLLSSSKYMRAFSGYCCFHMMQQIKLIRQS